ncbi:dienelactone hydrolase [Thermobaculum terrenum ATCC BAA-798]|uniref:Dienelactone hydrolase n=1 Tax=Thermobaculum terrenum (strain ATCC BAA-798 / CCMEE 7001 / YNP1) TaxID=525904 RepID=D1CFR4_THET1|nr:dienelactone hydrolase family protein [Thermobaculum terrenum]ACZ41770.1 dienelactone hydrolase [Thermobaculum terrenum ATCC BAA-798]
MNTLGEQEITILADSTQLKGFLCIPSDPRGLVIFAHGTGSSRFSPRNRFVAERLNAAGLATILMDLLSSEEEVIDLRSSQLRFDIPKLSSRVEAALHWANNRDDLVGLNKGLFGASTGAAAALITAARNPDDIGAVVSRGGRPDLAEPYLEQVKAATLLIVGSLDYPVIELNRRAFDKLNCAKRLEIVEGASHLFEEPGKLEVVADLARDWFLRYL